MIILLKYIIVLNIKFDQLYFIFNETLKFNCQNNQLVS